MTMADTAGLYRDSIFLLTAARSRWGICEDSELRPRGSHHQSSLYMPDGSIADCCDYDLATAMAREWLRVLPIRGAA